MGRPKTSKTMLSNVRNKEEAGEAYRKTIPKIIKWAKAAQITTAQNIFDRVTRVMREPWKKIVERRPIARSPHCNANLNYL